MHNHTWNGTHSGEADPYPELRQLLAPELSSLPPEEIESVIDALYGGEISAEDLESFWKKLGKVAQTALPIATTAVGTLFGGPLGGMLGGTLGKAASGAMGGATKGRRPSGRKILAGLTPALSQAAGGLLGGAKGGAATQLLSVLANPKTLQSLGAMALGPAGKRQTRVADMPVPVTAFANLLSVLANQAAAEHHQAGIDDSAGTPAYLLDGHGEAIGDIFDATSRAEVLLARLAEAETMEIAEFEPDNDDQIEAWDEAIESEEEFWTELALAEAEGT